MSILDIAVNDLDDAVELKPIDTTEEVKIRIVDIRQDLNKNDEPYLLLTFEALEIPGAKTFTKYYALPHPEMDKKKKNSASLSLRKLFQAFDIDYTSGQVDSEAMLGLETWAILGIEKPAEDSLYGPSNFIKKFVG